MTTVSERHNKFANEFVLRLGRECNDDSELMVVLESILVGAMLLNHKLYGLKASTASGLVEAAVQTAIERFTAEVQ